MSAYVYMHMWMCEPSACVSVQMHVSTVVVRTSVDIRASFCI